MNLDNVIARICETIKQGKAALFVGAGISIDPPSRLPRSRALRNAPVEGLLANYPPSVRGLIIEYAIANLSLEEVYGVFHEEIGKRLITTMANALDDDMLEPNELHRFVAKALSLGNIVVTTNYDRQIERAYFEETPEEDLEICYDGKTFEKFINNFEKGKNKWLLKIHGTIRVKEKDTSESVVTTLNRVGRGLPPKTKKALEIVLKRFPTLFLGYGCEDLDIVYPVLAQEKSEKEMWWMKHEGEKSEKSLFIGKDIQNLKTELPHITIVLLNRGENNNGKVFLIKYPTSEFMKVLIAKLDWKLTQPKSEGLSESHWRGEFFCLGHQASQIEKTSILATLARLGRETERGHEKRPQLTKLMQALYKEAIEESKDPLKTARLYRDLGFSLYLQKPKTAIEEHYKNAEELLKQVAPEAKPLLEEAELLSLQALAYRRSYQIMKAFEYASRAWEAIPQEIRDQLEKLHQNLIHIKYRNRELTDREKGNLGNILRRLANTYHDLVSDPATLSTNIRGPGWKREPEEEELLKKALQLVNLDRELQRAAGNIRERIQSENVLGLIATKLGKVDRAKEAHEESKREAFQLNWIRREYAQACRNLGLALEKEGNLDQAIGILKEAREKFAGEGDKLTTNWHIGRILINKGDAKGIYIIEEIKRERDWHWRCNDLVLLGIGYYDLLKNKEEAARKFFEQMLKFYEDTKDEEIKSRAYGIDNALANVRSAHSRLCPNGTCQENDFCKKSQSQRARLEKIRNEALEFIASFSL